MPDITYPGITGVISLEYTTSVGITPGIAALTVFPDSEPDLYGELEFGDGVTTITLPYCLLQYSETVYSGKDAVKIVRLLDRRWEWRDGYTISGHYNQTGPNQKYIPWTVRSPYQLARLLLARLGEYTLDGVIPAGTIDLPGGLASPAVAGIIPPVGPDDKVIDPVGEYLGLGQNVPQTVTNQLAVWSEIPAAVALANLCDLYGRVVVLDPTTDFVRIEKLGDGDDIPAGGVRASVGTSVTGEPIPKEIVAVGSPTKFTVRLYLEPVGKDWDGSWQPHSRLTYAPVVAGQKMKVHVLARYDAGSVYQIKFRVDKFSTEDIYIGSGGSMAAQLASLVTAINIDHGAVVTASATTNDRGDEVLQVEANTNGHEFELTTDGSSIYSAGRWNAECVVGPIPDADELQRVYTVDYTALTINEADDVTMTVNGTPYSETVDEGAGMTAEAAIAAVAAAADAGTSNISFSVGGRVVTLTGANSGITFTVSGAVNSDAATVTTVVSASEHRGFEKSWGRFGWVARATSQLSQAEASRLAEETVFRCFRVLCVNPSDHSDQTIPVPGYPPKEVEVDFSAVVIAVGETISVTLDGNTYTATAIPDETLEHLVEDLADRIAGNGHQVRVTHSGAYIWITANTVGYNFTLTAASSAGAVTLTTATGGIDNRYRLVLQNTRPEPIVPRPGDALVKDVRTGQPWAAETYNGFSVERPNIAYGSIWLGAFLQTGLGWQGQQYFGNTAPRSIMPIRFHLVDPERQVFAFERPVYRMLGRNDGFAALPPEIVVECGTLVLDDDLAPVRYSYTTKVVGGTAPAVRRVFPDIQQEVVATFDELHAEVEHHQLDTDASIRGQYYSEAIRDHLQLPEGEHVTYGGIQEISIGGLIRQIKWAISKAAPTTTASTNSEFSKVIPPFAIRRRSENLPADATRSTENILTDFRVRGPIDNVISMAHKFGRMTFGV